MIVCSEDALSLFQYQLGSGLGILDMLQLLQVLQHLWPLRLPSVKPMLPPPQLFLPLLSPRLQVSTT